MKRVQFMAAAFAIAAVVGCKAWDDAWGGPATNRNFSKKCTDAEQLCRDWRDDAGLHAGGCCPVESDGFVCAWGGQCRYVGTAGLKRDGGAEGGAS